MDWLRRNNAYYSYGVQKLDSIESFAASGDKATLEVVITEERTLYKNGKVAKDNTSFDTLLVRYSLEYVNGRTKISDYKSVRTIRKK